MSRLANAILDLSINRGYQIRFEVHPNSSPVDPHISVSLHAHGLNVRGNILTSQWSEDRVCEALKQLYERLELEAKAIKL